MTWRRVILRNGLSDGNYEMSPAGFKIMCNISKADDDKPFIGGVRREQLVAMEQRARNLAGDIRRLESDARDEQSINATISWRTGVERDDVAAVLKEFFSI